MAKKPYADTRLAQFLETRVLELKHKKTQSEIAEELCPKVGDGLIRRL